MICGYKECDKEIPKTRLSHGGLYCSLECYEMHNRSKRENRECEIEACRAWFVALKDSPEAKCPSCRTGKPVKKAKKTPKKLKKQYTYGSSFSPGKAWSDHRTSHCKKETHIKGNMINCGGYCSCSDLPFEEWKEKALAGGCWQEPNTVQANTLGTSIVRVGMPGFEFTR